MHTGNKFYINEYIKPILKMLNENDIFKKRDLNGLFLS